MDYIVTTLDNLVHQTAFFNLTPGNYLMIAVACVFLYLAIAKGFEPVSYTHLDVYKRQAPARVGRRSGAFFEAFSQI